MNQCLHWVGLIFAFSKNQPNQTQPYLRRMYPRFSLLGSHASGPETPHISRPPANRYGMSVFVLLLMNIRLNHNISNQSQNLNKSHLLMSSHLISYPSYHQFQLSSSKSVHFFGSNSCLILTPCCCHIGQRYCEIFPPWNLSSLVWVWVKSLRWFYFRVHMFVHTLSESFMTFTPI